MIWGGLGAVQTSWGETIDVEVPAGVWPGETFEVPSWAVLSSSGSPEAAIAGALGSADLSPREEKPPPPPPPPPSAAAPPQDPERKVLDQREITRLHLVQRQRGRQDALLRAKTRNCVSKSHEKEEFFIKMEEFCRSDAAQRRPVAAAQRQQHKCQPRVISGCVATWSPQNQRQHHRCPSVLLLLRVVSVPRTCHSEAVRAGEA